MNGKLLLRFPTGPEEVVIGKYPSGEPLIRHNINFRMSDYLTVRSPKIQDLVSALMLADACAYRGYPIRNFVLPYVPCARQDRLNPEGDFLFSLKSVAEMINARNFDSVTVLDPHSEVAPALINQCNVLNPVEIFKLVKFENTGYHAVIAPDGGSEKRALGIAKLFNIPLIRGWKVRDVSNGALKGFGLESTPSNIVNVLVVDDICDGGGTFIGLADIFRSRGMQADLYTTHGLYTAGIEKLCVYKNIICTDSLDHVKEWEHCGLRILPIVKILLGG